MALVAVTWTLKNEKMVALLKRQNDISHLCAPLLQCKPSVVVSSLNHPSLCKKSGSLKLQKLKFEILDTERASSNHATKELFVHEDLSFLNRVISSPKFKAIKDNCGHNYER